ncbi:adenylate/guanylate cyclase domain-containing protein [Aureibacter tunicatorum]|uniref:Adenylate cyclase n=1 Tax=Aureibacter tunicatorum TaxID=866807 RepID=A0AAE3XQT8_9BACT|nr:adenylate/guanylate cyclase domain-containing protein [Aureibacter tunicatorum]MDR6240255.1 adenylate cyclase [Aureibacter tunicatorum]BDD05864.1 hypothetical protein AUTU_33470 [Aureibacter tunicatorum]
MERVSNYQVLRHWGTLFWSLILWNILNFFFFYLIYVVFIDTHKWLGLPRFDYEFMGEALLTLSFYGGSILGVFGWLVSVIVSKKFWYNKMPYTLRLLLRMAITSLLLILINKGSVMVLKNYHESLYNYIDASNFFYSELFVVYFAFIMMCSLFMGTLQQLGELLGPIFFKNVIMGKYIHPREEERIFMFLDLSNSTKLAEELGHIKYSKLIQRCFADMTDEIVYHRAEVYQYVGDEIVLTWEKKKGLKNNRCVRLFYDIQKKFESKKDYYMQNYGVVPSFKAGLNSGLVTGVEVGIVKKELAFHGDVLNTASRLQHVCKEAGECILFTCEFGEELDGVSLRNVGVYHLKGKSKSSEVCTVDSLNTDVV